MASLAEFLIPELGQYRNRQRFEDTLSQLRSSLQGRQGIQTRLTPDGGSELVSGQVMAPALPVNPLTETALTLLGSESPQAQKAGLEQIVAMLQGQDQTSKIQQAIAQSKDAKQLFENVAGIPGLSENALNNLRQLETAQPKSPFANVQIDAEGNPVGLNIASGQFQNIPTTQDFKFSKFQTVQGTDENGSPITELVDTTRVGAPGGRITISKGVDVNTLRDVTDKAQAIVNVRETAADLKKTLEQTGARLLPSGEQLQLKTKYTDLALKLKEMAELGAITGPDMALLEGFVVDPTSIKGNLIDYFGGTEALVDQINTMEVIFERNLRNQMSRLPEKDRKSLDRFIQKEPPPPPGFK